MLQIVTGFILVYFVLVVCSLEEGNQNFGGGGGGSANLIEFKRGISYSRRVGTAGL